MFTNLRSVFGRLVRETRGGVLVTFAMSLPVMMCALGLVSDYAMLLKVRGDLQKAADAAAIAGAREIPLAGTNEKQVISAAKSYANYNLAGDLATSAQSAKGSDYEIEASVAKNFSAVKVDISEEWTPFFAHFIKSDITPVRVTATARFVGSSNICVLGLSPKLIPGVQLWNDAQLSANNCGVYSNTASANGFVVMDSGILKSQLNCVVGGYQTGTARSVEPTPVTDCPPIDDPLSSRTPPSVGGCDYNGLQIANQTKTLSPGVYCGGLIIRGTSNVTMNGGIYIIKNGPLVVTDTASLAADDTGFYLTGLNSLVWFNANTTVSLGAPVDGPLAGLLFFEDRAATGVRLHRIASNNARKLLGTIYLSKSILNIDANAPVADQSAYTAIVTQSLQLQSGPNLILNSDYSATKVPVPEGIKGASQVILTE
jgi:Flp pilus assembly protein TadG